MKGLRKMEAPRYLWVGIMLFVPLHLGAQEVDNRFQYRGSVALSHKITQALKIELAPEIRWDEAFDVDRYQLNAELGYTPLKGMTLYACYRLIAKQTTNDAISYLNRYQFSAKYHWKWDRWKPGIRLSYTNYTDDSEGESFLRYKAFAAYNLKNTKLSPEAGVEVFQQISNGQLFKYRYKLGADYKLNKQWALNAAYKLDYYLTKYRNRHIFDVGLTFKF